MPNAEYDGIRSPYVTVIFSIYFSIHEGKSFAKITLCVKPNPYATGTACLVSSQN